MSRYASDLTDRRQFSGGIIDGNLRTVQTIRSSTSITAVVEIEKLIEDAVDHDGNHEESSSFKDFTKLPPEVRFMIWEMYCPALVAPTRILDFVIDGFGKQPSKGFPFASTSTLDACTRQIRRVLAVHQETRALVLKRLPNTLVFWRSDLVNGIRVEKQDPQARTGLVRYNARQNIISLQRVSYTMAGSKETVPEKFWHEVGRDYYGYEAESKPLFFNIPHRPCNLEDIAWLAHPSVHRVVVRGRFKQSRCFPAVNDGPFGTIDIPAGVTDVAAPLQAMATDLKLNLRPMITYRYRDVASKDSLRDYLESQEVDVRVLENLGLVNDVHGTFDDQHEQKSSLERNVVLEY